MFKLECFEDSYLIPLEILFERICSFTEDKDTANGLNTYLPLLSLSPISARLMVFLRINTQNF